MKSLGIHWWAGLVLLVSCGFSFADGLLVPDPPIILLAGMMGAGMLICEFSMQDHVRRHQPAPALLTGHSRN
jgi:hypothetical protein